MLFTLLKNALFIYLSSFTIILCCNTFFCFENEKIISIYYIILYYNYYTICWSPPTKKRKCSIYS